MKVKKKTAKGQTEIVLIELINRLPNTESTEDMVNIAKSIQYLSEAAKTDKHIKLDPNVWVPVAVSTAGGIIIYTVNWYLSGDRIIDWKIMESAKRFFGRK